MKLFFFPRRAPPRPSRGHVFMAAISTTCTGIVDEHIIAVSATNPVHCTPEIQCAGLAALEARDAEERQAHLLRAPREAAAERSARAWATPENVIYLRLDD
jgi:hypothetical protein